MLVYLAIQLVGMSLYGVEAWTRRGDAFGVWFGLLALLAPVGRRADGRLVLRPPVVSATRLVAVAGTTALLLVAIGSTGFDGAKEGPLFNDVVTDLQDAFTGLGASKGFGLELAFVVGLLISIAVVAAIWAVGVLGMPRKGLRLSRRELGRRFAHTLIPIAAAYLVAHYFSALAYNGQDLWRLASDPLGDGSDLFGGADARDRLLGRLGDRDLVRAGGGARARPRGRAGARARPRARRLRQPARRHRGRRSSCSW